MNEHLDVNIIGCQEPTTKVTSFIKCNSGHIKYFDGTKIFDFCCAPELFFLHQESMILECSQDFSNLEVSRIKVGSLRKKQFSTYEKGN